MSPCHRRWLLHAQEDDFDTLLDRDLRGNILRMMARRSGFVAAATLLFASAASATPIPRYETVLMERFFPRTPAPVRFLSSPPFQSTKLVAIDTEITLDPVGGALTGNATLNVTALSDVSTLSILIDSGLTVTNVTAPGKTVTFSSQDASGYTYASLSISPPIAAGETVAVTATYSGTLDCSIQNCKTGLPLAFLIEGSAMPLVLDQDSVGFFNAWGATRKLVLSLPSGTNAVASGDLTSEDDDGTQVTTTWEIPGFHSYGGNVVMIGDFASTPVTGADPTTSVWAVSDDQNLVPEMASWMTDILPFMQVQSGKALPYQELKVFKLPVGWVNIFRGTAGYGLTLLSEDYAQPTVETFEETLAHENAHQWWGVLVSPTDVRKTRWLVEGLATLSQIDYAAQYLHADSDRDEYLAHRFREHWMTVRFMGDPTFPIVAPTAQGGPEDPIQDSVWAYFRSSAFLEHLRVVVGDDSFAATLKIWADQCAQKFCDTADFLTIINDTSGTDVTSLFSQHVYNGNVPAPRISFEQPTGGKLSVTAFDMPGQKQILELFIELEDGSLNKEKVTLEDSTPIVLDISERVIRVRPNPRHDGFVWSRSATPGDVDFDGEVDGMDVIQCARSLDRSSGAGLPDGEGIWQHDLSFDPRCDDDDDGAVIASDLAKVTGAFGTLKGAQ